MLKVVGSTIPCVRKNLPSNDSACFDATNALSTSLHVVESLVRRVILVTLSRGWDLSLLVGGIMSPAETSRMKTVPDCILLDWVEWEDVLPVETIGLVFIVGNK